MQSCLGKQNHPSCEEAGGCRNNGALVHARQYTSVN